MPQWISAVADTIILVGLVVNYMYIRTLEKNIDALKSWIEVFWKVDFDAIAEAIADTRIKGGE